MDKFDPNSLEVGTDLLEHIQRNFKDSKVTPGCLYVQMFYKYFYCGEVFRNSWHLNI